MYLSDSRIRALLSEMHFATPDDATDFDPDSQIQPCSVDLRLCSTFWRPLKKHTIDLRKPRLLELQPRRNYKRFVLRPGEHYTLRPGKLLLARIHEQFSVPAGYAGEIVGRSSFSRLGLMIHCTGGFINPGWRGHMPLQLVNMSENPIKIFPHLPICQLRLVKVDGSQSRLYGEQELQSKYMDDDGGPSYWWRDKRVRSLQDALTKVDISLGIQDDILQLTAREEPEVIERLEALIARSKVQDLESAEVILQRFTKAEDRRRAGRKVLKTLAMLIFPAVLAVSLRWWFTEPFERIDLIFALLSIVSLVITLYGHGWDIGDHFGFKELTQARSSPERTQHSNGSS